MAGSAPETFTGVREFALPSEKDRADLLGELAAFIRPLLDRIRLMRESYPPRIDLEFTLRDGSGGALEEGRRELRDMNDLLRYEKDLLRDWLRSEISRAS